MSENLDLNESIPNGVPNEREVFNKFEEILGAREFIDKGKVEDEIGLVTWDIETTDELGDQIDITYARAKKLTTRDGFLMRPSRIHQTLYSNGIPCGVGTQYDFINGQWVAIE